MMNNEDPKKKKDKDAESVPLHEIYKVLVGHNTKVFERSGKGV